jgi:hypothetical protein
MMMYAKAIQMMPEKDMKFYLATAAGLGLFAANMLLMAPAIIGVPGLIAMSGALFIYGKAIGRLPNIPIAQYAGWSYGLKTMAKAMVSLGNPLTLPMLLIGVAKAAAIGGGIYALGRGLSQIANVNVDTATKNADNILLWTKSAVKQVASIKSADLQAARNGMHVMNALGSTVSAFARVSKLAKQTGPIDLKGLKAKELAGQMRIINNALTTVDTKALGVIIEASNAVTRVANLDLSRLGRAIQIREAKLLDYLAKITENTKKISDYTKPTKSEIDIKKRSDGSLEPIKLEDGDKVDITTIALQLQELTSILQSKR